MATILGFMLLCLLCMASISRTTLGVRSPDADSLCKSRVEIYGYECQEHTVTTKDGYILSLQRIPRGRSSSTTPPGANKLPVLLQHGILMDGHTWLYNSPDESLGYILADNGYDVWIANSRGTMYSRRHAWLSPHHPAYWDWSWDELAAYDLPAVFNFVYQQAGKQKIQYVGHSLGTLIALASFSQRRLVSMVRSAALLSPIGYLDHISSPLARSAAHSFTAEAYHWSGVNEVVPTGSGARELVTSFCRQPGADCYNIISSFTGKNCCLNSSSVQLLERHGAQSISTKNGVHMSQMVRRGTITKYDYGDIFNNMIHYGQANPPAYNMSNIPHDFPLFLSYGGQDALSDVIDVQHLLERLKFHDVDKLMVQYQENYAHLDFVMGADAKQVVYDPLIAYFKLHEIDNV